MDQDDEPWLHTVGAEPVSQVMALQVIIKGAT